MQKHGDCWIEIGDGVAKIYTEECGAVPVVIGGYFTENDFDLIISMYEDTLIDVDKMFEDLSLEQLTSMMIKYDAMGRTVVPDEIPLN